MQVNCYKRHNKSVFKITGDIFDGDYGSEVENRLENEFYSLLDKKERIQVAKVKWSNARLLLDQIKYAFSIYLFHFVYTHTHTHMYIYIHIHI